MGWVHTYTVADTVRTGRALYTATYDEVSRFCGVSPRSFLGWISFQKGMGRQQDLETHGLLFENRYLIWSEENRYVKSYVGDEKAYLLSWFAPAWEEAVAPFRALQARRDVRKEERWFSD